MKISGWVTVDVPKVGPGAFQVIRLGFYTVRTHSMLPNLVL